MTSPERGRRRDERLLQRDADAVRLPERASLGVGGAERLPQGLAFFFASKVEPPLLIVHGDEDANPGTTPLQATKLYEAIRGNGGTVRLVMLPHEPHWYSAMESQEQQIYEMVRWFDLYVKNAAPRVAAK